MAAEDSDGARPAFALPYVEDNVDGWGPVTLPRDLEGMPYAPYSKSDKIGRIADWNNQNPRGRQIDSYRACAPKKKRAHGRKRMLKNTSPAPRAPALARALARASLRCAGDRLYSTGIQNQMFGYYQEEDETSFQLVDNRTKMRNNNPAGFRPIVRARLASPRRVLRSRSSRVL